MSRVPVVWRQVKNVILNSVIAVVCVVDADALATLNSNKKE